MNKGSKELKKMVFHSSFEEQRDYGQQYAASLSEEERLVEMYRLNRKIFGKKYGRISISTEICSGTKGESIKDFYSRINRK